jgi:hypothetical protein
MTIFKPATNGVTRFTELKFKSTPPKVAENVRKFIEEDISAYSLFDLRAFKRSMDLPEGTRLYTGINPMEALVKASKAHGYRALLRGIFTGRKPVLDDMLDEGSAAIYCAGIASGRSSDMEGAIIKANVIMFDALVTKLKPDGQDITPIQLEICASAGLMAALKVLADVDFPYKVELNDHAQERWNFIDNGFGIYIYDRGIPYLYCVEKGGTASLSAGNNSISHGPICAP